MDPRAPKMILWLTGAKKSTNNFEYTKLIFKLNKNDVFLDHTFPWLRLKMLRIELKLDSDVFYAGDEISLDISLIREFQLKNIQYKRDLIIF